MKKFITLFAIIFIFQFDLSAQAAFQKVITVTGYPDFVSTGIHRCSDNGFLLCGYDGATNEKGFIIKMDASFHVLWSKKFSDSSLVELLFYNVGESVNGGYYALGYTIDQNYFTNCFFLKMDNAGTILWEHQYAMNPGDIIYGNVPPKVKELPSGEFLISAAMYGSMGIIKTDANGTMLFAKSFIGDTTEPKDPGLDAIVCDDGGIMATGKRGNDPYFVKTDALGNVQWSKIFTVPYFYNRIYSLLQTSDGGYLVTGMKCDSSSIISGFVMKLDVAGSVAWYKEYSTNNYFYFTDIKKLSSGDYLLLGFDMENNLRVFVTIDANGVLQSSVSVGVPNVFAMITNYNGFEVSASDRVLLTYSDYSSSTHLRTYLFNAQDPALDWCDVSYFPLTETTVFYSPVISSAAYIQSIPLSAATLPSSQPASFFVADYCVNPSVNELPAQNNYSIFPNPVIDFATIKIDPSLIDEHTIFILFDMLGNEAKAVEIKSSETEFEKGILPAGCYMYKIISGKGMIGNGKIIVAD
jgi:hypothetical protein